MSFRFGDLPRINIGLCLLALLLSLPPVATAVDYAPIMPGARQSLLLDSAKAGGRLLVAGERGHVLYSDDGGDSWEQARVPTTQMLTALFFVDDKRGWAVGHDGLILVTDDAGSNWRIQRDGISAQHQTNLQLREQAYDAVKTLEHALGAVDDTERVEVELQLEDAVMDLEDADIALEEDVFTSPLMDVWFQDKARGWAVGAFGTLLATTNGGQTWVNQAALIENPDEFHLNAITGDSEGRVFIAGEGGVMYRSLDGGDSWETLDAFYEGSWFGTVYTAFSDNLLVFGLRGNLYQSGDFGTSWQQTPGDNSITLAGGATGPAGDVVIVGGVGTLLFSSDGGKSFKQSTMVDRLSLSSALYSKGRLILVGQGGVKVYQDGIDND